MTAAPPLPELRMIPLNRIEVLNPRERNQRKFSLIVDNIGAVGLKKPVTVTPRPGNDGAERYSLFAAKGGSRHSNGSAKHEFRRLWSRCRTRMPSS